MHHLFSCPRRESFISEAVIQCQALVRFFALRRIKPHTPPLVRAPVNSFEFHRCRRTPQVGCLTLSLGRLRQTQTASIHRLPRGLPGYLILFAPHAFAPQRQLSSRKSPSPPVFFLISTHFTATLGIPLSSPILQPLSFHPITGLSPALLRWT